MLPNFTESQVVASKFLFPILESVGCLSYLNPPCTCFSLSHNYPIFNGRESQCLKITIKICARYMICRCFLPFLSDLVLWASHSRSSLCSSFYRWAYRCSDKSGAISTITRILINDYSYNVNSRLLVLCPVLFLINLAVFPKLFMNNNCHFLTSDCHQPGHSWYHHLLHIIPKITLYGK